MFTESFKQHKINPYSSRQWNRDVECVCCGRGIPDRNTAYVTIIESGGYSHWGIDENPRNQVEVITFRPISEAPLGRDSVEWGSFVGSGCAKRIPKEYKITQKRVIKEWVKNGQS